MSTEAPAAPAAAAAAAPAPAAPAAHPTGEAPAIPAVASAPAAAATPAAVEPPKPGEAPKPAAAAPAAFDPKGFKAPEGFTADEAVLGSFATVINNDKLNPAERGQQLLDLHAAELKKASEAGTKSWQTLNTKWVDEIKADKDLGGDKLPATQQTIAKAIDSLGAESAKAFREALNITGAGNNPAIVRGLMAFASKLTEGGHVTGAAPKTMSIAETFFPSMQPKG